MYINCLCTLFQSLRFQSFSTCSIQHTQKPQEQNPSNNNNNNHGLQHFRKTSLQDSVADIMERGSENYRLPHPVWSEDELNSVTITHTPPEKAADKVQCTTNGRVHMIYLSGHWSYVWCQQRKLSSSDDDAM